MGNVKKNQTTKEQTTDTNIPATTDQATDNQNPPAMVEEVKAMDVAKDVVKLSKQTGKKIWRKVKKPLAIAGGVILATGALLVGSEMIAQSKANNNEPDNPEEDDDLTVYDLEPDEVEITDEETEETPEETTTE